jgi:hypothetical protein
MENRRDFVIKLVRGTAYAAPIVTTLASPHGLSAQQNTNSQKGGMGMGRPGTQGTGSGMTTKTVAPGSITPETIRAPWESKPPGGR